MMLPWGNFQVEAPGGITETHLVPGNDLSEHMLCAHCECRPVEDDTAPDYWHHNAWDDRESYERGRRTH